MCVWTEWSDAGLNILKILIFSQYWTLDRKGNPASAESFRKNSSICNEEMKAKGIIVKAELAM